ncbi:Aste57867_20869 [Aphanomyces stellatus]|uniref:Aste57867_20869 protein n=1 Tax=Aphanomyces stellatus TaxID=120398 RepID=A0A485LHH0_9STRA|nr:hypothetical protein As57867_020801 [Aphanomyces stellatus]VFT97546.1 Aste57867_20869 [Aphanomyces stellatus]
MREFPTGNAGMYAAAAVGLVSVPLLAAAYFHQPGSATSTPVIKLVDVTLTDDELIKQGFATKKIPADIDVIVIGSGMGGLTAAAALAKEGKRVLVLEQHDVAGGNTHTFEEKGYEFDTGLHYIGGYLDNKAVPSRKLFDYISNDGIEFQHLGRIVDRVVVGNGSRDELDYTGDLRDFKRTLKQRFPDDHKAIDAYFSTLDRSRGNTGILFALQLCPTWARSIFRWWNAPRFEFYRKTAAEVAATLTTNQDLLGAFTYNWGDVGEPPGRAAYATTASVLQHYCGGGYYPIGGPSVIPKKIARVIESHGGKVLVRAPVETILIDANGAAYGVRVKGQDILARTIISTAGATPTYTKFIPEAHSHRIAHLVKELSNPDMQACVSLMSLFVGFKGDAKALGLPTYNVWKYPSWHHDANFNASKASPDAPFCAVFMSFSSAKDPTYATRFPGKQVGLVIAPSFYDHVEQFKDGRVKHRGDTYDAMKESWKERLLTTFLEEFPKVTRESIEVLELGTALTNDYYLGTTRGAVYGLGHTPARYASDATNVRTPIANLFLSGQDVIGCGVIGAAYSGLVTAAIVEPKVIPTLGRIFGN